MQYLSHSDAHEELANAKANAPNLLGGRRADMDTVPYIYKV
jgi:hypothetical protein